MRDEGDGWGEGGTVRVRMRSEGDRVRMRGDGDGVKMSGDSEGMRVWKCEGVEVRMRSYSS